MGGMSPFGLDESIKMRTLGSPQHPILVAQLDTVGNGSGTTNMATTADVYFTRAPASELYVIDTIDILIEDGGALDVDGWGSIAALTTGCKFDITRKETATVTAYSVHDFTSGVPLKHHGHLARLGEVEFSSEALGCIVQVHICRQDPIRLDGDKGEALVFETQDDLSALTSMEIVLHGRHCFAKG